jgi:hypothetical protein
MPKIQVWAQVCDARFEALQEEAKRRGVSVESLVEATVNELLREFEHDESQGTGNGCPCIPS